MKLDEICDAFAVTMQVEMKKMWAGKLGLDKYSEDLFRELTTLMIQTSVDYTIFFRELSTLPESIVPLKKSFYMDIENDVNLIERWSEWLSEWRKLIGTNSPDLNATTSLSQRKLSKKMKQTNPKYILREWHLVSAYQKAKQGNYTMIYELQNVMTAPYDEQTKEIEEKYYTLKPAKLFNIGGVSHVSCSS